MASKLLTLRASHTEHVLVPFLTDMYSIWMPPFSLGCNHVQTEFCSFPSHTAKKLNGISPDLSTGREYLQPSGHNLLTRTLEAKEIKLCEDQKSHWFQLLPLLAKKKKKKLNTNALTPFQHRKIQSCSCSSLALSLSTYRQPSTLGWPTDLAHR